MVVDIELTRHAVDKYTARVLLWPDIKVEAPSREAALSLIGDAIRQRRSAGIEIVQLAIEDEKRDKAPIAWRRHAGAFPDDELYQEMLTEIERNRQELDADV